MELSRPTKIIFAILAVVAALALLEQYRIGNDSVLALRGSFIAANGAPVVLEPKHGRVEAVFAGERDRVAFTYDSDVQRLHRVSVVLKYQAEGCEKLAVRVFGAAGPRDHFPKCSGRSGKGRIRTWHTSFLSAPGSFSLSLSAPAGTRIVVHEVRVKSYRSTVAGPDFSGKIVFLAILIALAIPVYWALRRRRVAGEWFLVSLSLLALFVIEPFFAAGLLVLLSLLFLCKRPLAEHERRGLVFPVVLLTGVAFLLVFKYAPNAYYSMFLFLGGSYVGLPLGVSYFVFRLIHVIIEWYRQTQQELTFREYLCFLLFLPTIPAGPIETVDGFFAKRLEKLDWDVVGEALSRILSGLFKKMVLVSMLIGPLLFDPGKGLFDLVTNAPWQVGYQTIFSFLCLCLLYAYLDLSAYTDIAIGLGLLFGHRIRENFDWPIFKPNVAEFWRSYHISLGNWCQQNAYFPVLMLTRSTNLAIYLSMLTMGLWHHINLNWLFWGLHHGTGIVWIGFLGGWLHKHFSGRSLPKVVLGFWHPIRVGLTFCFVAGGTALVFIDDISTAMAIYFRFFTLH